MKNLPYRGGSAGREGALRRLGTGRRRTPRWEQLTAPRLARQILCAVLLLVFVVILGSLPWAVTDSAGAFVYRILTEDSDWSRLAGGLLQRAGDIPVFRDTSVGEWLATAVDTRLAEPEESAFSLPVYGEIVSPFGWREDPDTGAMHFHTGVDLQAEIGTPVMASAVGMVQRVWDDEQYGLAVEVEHADGFSTLYAHLSEVRVEEGDEVGPGEVIAMSGESGRTSGPHLHFEIRADGKPIDPVPHLVGREDD